MKKEIAFITRAGLTAAVYVMLTLISPLSSGQIQVRFSEALCVLPLVMPESVPGLFAGCALSGALLGANALDVVFGSLTTLAAAYLTRRLRHTHPALALLPPVLLNALVTGTVVYLVYVAERTPLMWLATMLSVGAGEAVAVYGLGALVKPVLGRLPQFKGKIK